ncbi:MAG: hypothetical protein F6K28_34085, partial [Microcoleus sp. SIO2G3]|nr:hypothetical protein [Microcoleus sp. SIO2G3]
MPWSRPVRVVDPFEGEFLAVFDRNDIGQRFREDGGPSRFVSLWSRDSIRVLLLSEQGCNHVFFGHYLSGGCDQVEVPRVVETLYVRVGYGKRSCNSPQSSGKKFAIARVSGYAASSRFSRFD